jgi:hypothetical protein
VKSIANTDSKIDNGICHPFGQKIMSKQKAIIMKTGCREKITKKRNNDKPVVSALP